MPDTETRLRRLTRLAEAVMSIDTEADDLVAAVHDLQEKAHFALSDRRLKIGNPALEKARRLAIEARKARGMKTAETYLPIIDALRRQGFTTRKALADRLTELGIKPPRSDKWHPSTVRAIEERRKS